MNNNKGRKRLIGSMPKIGIRPIIDGQASAERARGTERAGRS
mgnify:CR=1 FL=1